MKVIFYCAYYEPERAAGIGISKDILRGLADAGVSVDVFTPTPTRGVDQKTIEEYKNKHKEYLYDGRVCIHRIRMIQEKRNPAIRALRYFLLNISFWWKGICSGGDVIFVDSTPPTQGLMAAAVKKIKRIPIVYNLQDIFPDSMITAGFTKQGSILWKIGRCIENSTYRNSNHIITISDSMKKNILIKGVDDAKVSTICNWIDLDSVFPVQKENNTIFNEFGIPKDQFIVLYAGNFGAAQGANIILDVAHALRENKEICFVVFGGGSEFEDFKTEAKKHNNIFVNGLLPMERVSEVYSLGDVALITCKRGVGTSGMPSKTWSILACETPIIASFDVHSDLAQVIHDAKAGTIVEPENVQKLTDAIVDAYDSWKHNKERVYGLRRYVEENASREKCVKRYVDVIVNAFPDKK